MKNLIKKYLDEKRDVNMSKLTDLELKAIGINHSEKFLKLEIAKKIQNIFALLSLKEK